jgi:hypothetical protein
MDGRGRTLADSRLPWLGGCRSKVSATRKGTAFNDLPTSYETDLARVYVHFEIERLFGGSQH